MLRELRARDRSYRLFVKGSSPWGLKWVEDRPEEVEYFAEIRRRLDEDPLLADAVTFDPPGPDVADWLQKIGWLLSTSDDESFHLSPAEGMASGAVPVVRPWPGADEVYDPEWVVDGAKAMAERIVELNGDEESWRQAGSRARGEVRSKYAIDDVTELWISEVLSGGRPGSLRVSLLSTRNPYRDPDFMALARSLDSVGHRVSVISKATADDSLPPTVNTPSVGLERPARFSWRWWRRRFGSTSDDHDSLAAALDESRPDLVYPQRPEDVPLADDVGAPVVRMPTWQEPGHDLVAMAPHAPALSVSPTTPRADANLLPEWTDHTPAAGRHDGMSATIVYRVTPTSPGRYLESALRRAGVATSVLDGELDWSRVPPETDFVIVVESAYPAMTVGGSKPAVPTLFWVHHGEHHLAANLRLTRRYQADAVLLAHSWHLAHRFPVPTHRFPFAVATELDPRPRAWAERSHDVAIVGSGIGGTGKRYDRRREIVDDLASADGVDVEVAYGMAPEEMIALYGDSRIVVNDGGPRHFPITMRVFETLGSGALLLTEDIPGTDTLLKRDEHYVPMRSDVGRQVGELLDAHDSASVADAGHGWALERHTYDHRVDRLVEIAARLRPGDSGDDPFPPLTRLGGLIDQDVEVQHVAVFGDVGPLGLEDRAIRAGDASTLSERSIDAVVIGAGAGDELRDAVRAARGYVYSDESHRDEVVAILAEDRPEAAIQVEDGLLRADLGGMHYRMRPADHPLAT